MTDIVACGTNVPSFASLGVKVGDIDVLLDRWLMRWFCEGPHAGPYKAIQELAANAFDAGARHVAVSISRAEDMVAVIDDGAGMDPDALRQHWQTGVSSKDHSPGSAKMGRFGIGKLATYALAGRLTHITKNNRTIHSASVAYGEWPLPKGHKERMATPLRRLSEREAAQALAPWRCCPALTASQIVLFGDAAATTWTVSIMSSLKDVASDLTLEGLRSFLVNKLPLGENFSLWLHDKQNLVCM